MEQQTLRDFEALCVQEEAPACQSSCPLHVEARTFIQFMAEGKIAKARQQLDRTLPLSCVTAYLCEGPCKQACKRASIDDAINMPLLERACILNSPPPRIMPLPATGKKICVAGSGLSSLVLALELGKKGHSVHVYHKNDIGSDIARFAGERLPENALGEAISLLKAVRVEFLECAVFDDVWLNSVLGFVPNSALDSILDSIPNTTLDSTLDSALDFVLDSTPNSALDFDLVYLGLDDSAVANSSFSLDKKDGSYTDNPLTLITENPKILAGGYAGAEGYTGANNEGAGFSFIQCMVDAKKAVGSINRILQGVAPETAREAEAPYPTKLYTNLKGIDPLPYKAPKNLLIPQMDEAREEASRCIQCACLECVKQCSYLASYKAYPKRYLREIFNNLSVVHGLRLANTMTNSCTDCGLCAKICPQGLDMGEFCALARREMVKTKRMPPSAHEFALEDMYSSNVDTYFFKHQAGHTSSAYMFFPGCQLPAVLPRQVMSAYEHIQEHLSGGVGFHFACCGMPASWAGKEEYLQITIDAFRNNWEFAGKPMYIYACASCSEFFNKHCADIPHISLWEILADMPLPIKRKSLSQLSQMRALQGESSQVQAVHGQSLQGESSQGQLSQVQSSQSQLSPVQRVLAIHDPCSSRNFPSMQAGLRKFVSALQQDYTELEFGREMTRCCGFGGLAAEANPKIADGFVLERIADTENALLVYCAICRERMQKMNKNCVHVLEIAFPTESLDKAIQTSFLSLFERRGRRLTFRNSILEQIWGEKVLDMHETQAIQLNISSDVENILNERRILRSDIIAVLSEAEENGASFYNAQTGRSLASFRPRQVSYWVEYKKEDDASYSIFDAYCHRMSVPGVSGEGALPNFETACCKEHEQENKA